MLILCTFFEGHRWRSVQPFPETNCSLQTLLLPLLLSDNRKPLTSLHKSKHFLWSQTIAFIAGVSVCVWVCVWVCVSAYACWDKFEKKDVG